MAWLESFLAFALTMLVFSTVITIIIEGIHRVLLYREKGMQALVGSLFDTVIWPRFGKFFISEAVKVEPTDTDKVKTEKLAQQEAIKSKTHEDFVAMLTSGEGVTEKARGLLGRFVPKQITSLTSMQFAERLAQTEIGKAIVTDVQAALKGTVQEIQLAVDQVIKDLVQKFERFGAEATEFFKRRSHLMAVLIGFVLVFLANFDAIQVFKAYLNDDKLREALIANSDAIQKQHSAAIERLRQTADGEGEAADSARKLIDQLEKSRAEADKALADLRAKGVPIGWSNFPHCAPLSFDARAAAGAARYADTRCQRIHAAWLALAEKRCSEAFGLTEEQAPKDARYKSCVADTEKERLSKALGFEFLWEHHRWDVAYWFFAVVLAGALVGLGGPFWYDTVRSLSSVLQLLRPSAPAPKPEPGATLRGAVGEPRTRQPENPVEAFKTAADARKKVSEAAPQTP